MGTIMEITLETLESAKKPMEFEAIFQSVKKQLIGKWVLLYPHLPEEEILSKYRGDLYKILTVSGKFSRTLEGEWELNNQE